MKILRVASSRMILFSLSRHSLHSLPILKTPSLKATNRDGSQVAGQNTFVQSLARSQAVAIEIMQESVPNVDDSLMGLKDQAMLGVESPTL